MSGQSMEIKTPDGTFQAYVARPKADKAPAVVVIQEIFGVNAVMRGVADDLAAQGFLAICPDLFWRIEPGVQLTDQTEAEWKRAFEFFNAFDVDKGVSDIQATLAAARSDTQSSGKVGAVGYCLGGLLAYLTAARTDCDASVGYYGVGLDKRLGEQSGVKKPLLLHIADEDQFCPTAARDEIVAGLKDNALITLARYPGRDHAFARKGGQHYDAADAAKADAATLAFFRKALV